MSEELDSSLEPASGETLPEEARPVAQFLAEPEAEEPPPIFEVNTSGTDEPLPPEIGRMPFNVGAFFGGFVWALGNRAWVGVIDLLAYPLLPLMPVWRLLMAARGSEWAWRARKWDSVEHFRRVQRRWAWVGGLLLLAQIGLGLYFFVKTGSSIIPAAIGGGGG